MTRNRVEKELYKMRDEGIIPDKIVPEQMGLIAKHLPRRIYQDCVKEEPEMVREAGEYFGKTCSSIVMCYAKEILLNRTWNPVLKLCLEIKQEYIEQFGSEPSLYDADGYSSCIERWIDELNEAESYQTYTTYRDIFANLQTTQYGNLVLIRYILYQPNTNDETIGWSEDFWDRYNGLYRECRSVVVDLNAGCLVLAPFKKFFNIDEIEETKFNIIKDKIQQAKCVEFSNKLDGSMQCATWYQDHIIMCGSKSLDPEKSWRLQEGCRMIAANQNYQKMLQDNPNLTFVFEYIALKDAHVVQYTKEEEGLYLIGMRNKLTGEELSYREILAMAKTYGALTTALLDKTLDQVMSELDSKTSDEAEGFVINIDGYKVKLKYNDYVHIHKILSRLTSVNVVIQSVADNTLDDLIAKIPDVYRDFIKHIAGRIMEYEQNETDTIKQYYNVIPKETKKDFMIYVNTNVPKEYRKYCVDLYYGREINVLKDQRGSNTHYKKLKDIAGLQDIFNREEGG